MRLTDLIVEVRDRSLKRVGQILPKDLNLDATVLFNNVGTWTLVLAKEHSLVDTLRSPGAGIIVTGPGGNVLLSGPVTSPAFAASADDALGSITFTGVSDDIILSDYLAWPQPTNADVTTQAAGHDDRSGPAETLMHQYVAANVGPNAPAGRRNPLLAMGPNGARGTTLTKAARFPSLGTLLTEIAAVDRLGFRIRQNGAGLLFETFATVDRTAYVRLSTTNNGVSSQTTTITAPTVTRAIVGGSGELEDRKFVQVDNTASVSAEADWGRRIEVFIDQRQDDGTDQMVQAGAEALAEGGLTATNIQLVPSQDSPMTFGVDWGLGDAITAEVDGMGEATAYVTGYAFSANDQGFSFAVTLSDAIAQKSTVKKVEDRISHLERTESPGSTTSTPGTGAEATFSFTTASSVWTCVHNFNQAVVQVACFDSNGAEVVGDVTFVDANTTRISWYYPMSGSVRIQT